MADRELLRKCADLAALAEKHRIDAARAQGRCDALLKRLKDEHGCDSPEAAEGHLRELEEQIRREEASLAQQVRDFEETYGDRLKEV